LFFLFISNSEKNSINLLICLTILEQKTFSAKIYKQPVIEKLNSESFSRSRFKLRKKEK